MVKNFNFLPDLNIVFLRGSDSKNWKFINDLDDEDEVFVDESISLVIRASSRCFSNIRAQAVFDYILFSKYGAINIKKKVVTRDRNNIMAINRSCKLVAVHTIRCSTHKYLAERLRS